VYLAAASEQGSEAAASPYPGGKDMSGKNKRRYEDAERLIAEAVENAELMPVEFPSTKMHSVIVYVLRNHVRQFTAWLNEDNAAILEGCEPLTVHEVKHMLYQMHGLTHAAAHMEAFEEARAQHGNVFVFGPYDRRPDDSGPSPYL
jgi:hypothetical protein